MRIVVLPLLAALPFMALAIPAARAGFPGANLAFQWIVYAAWGWWAVRSARAMGLPEERFTTPPRDPGAWRYLLLVPPLIVLCLSALLVQTRLAAAVFPSVERFVLAVDPDEATSSTLLTALTALTGATLAPVVEEVVFRGILLRAWAARFGLRRAVIGTSILFGFLHHDAIGSVVFGLVLATVYLRVGTLLVPIGMHAAYNALVGVAMFVESDGPLTHTEFRQTFLPSVLAMTASLVVIVLGMRYLARRGTPIPRLAET